MPNESPWRRFRTADIAGSLLLLGTIECNRSNYGDGGVSLILYGLSFHSVHPCFLLFPPFQKIPG